MGPACHVSRSQISGISTTNSFVPHIQRARTHWEAEAAAAADQQRVEFAVGLLGYAEVVHSATAHGGMPGIILGAYAKHCLAALTSHC